VKILNANPGVGAPLTEQQTKDFLTASKLNIHIGTVDEKGHANIHPVWYYYDTSNNKFYILTGKDSKKVNNLKGNDIIYYCVDDPNPPYKGVRGKGNVIVHENVNFNVTIAQKIAFRYIGTLDHPISHELVERLKNGQGIVLEISPIYYSTWDQSKL
jgi:hypothetical protein